MFLVTWKISHNRVQRESFDKFTVGYVTSSNRCTQTMLTFKGLTQSVPVCCSDVFAEVLGSGDLSRCLAELEEVPISSLWPRNSTLRVLASLLTAEDVQVNKAAANYLSSGASHCHFKARVRVCLCMCDSCIFNILDRCSKSCVNVCMCVCRQWSTTLRRCRRLEVRVRGRLVRRSAACRSVASTQRSHTHTLRFPFEHVVCTCMSQKKVPFALHYSYIYQLYDKSSSEPKTQLRPKSLLLQSVYLKAVKINAAHLRGILSGSNFYVTALYQITYCRFVHTGSDDVGGFFKLPLLLRR